MLYYRIKKLALSLLFLFLTAALFSSCSKPKWKKLVIKGTRVELLFPEKPVQTSKTLHVPRVGQAKYSYISLHKGDIFYSISVLKANDAEMIFNIDDLSPRSLLRKGARLTRVRTLTVDGLEGKEFLLKYTGRKIKQRMFVDSNKIYTAIVIYNHKDRLSAKKFLRSIRFTKRNLSN